MIAKLSADASEHMGDDVVRLAEEHGYKAAVSRSRDCAAVGITGKGEPALREKLAGLPGVEAVIVPEAGCTLASRHFQPYDTVIRIGDLHIGGGGVSIIGGPSAYRSAAHMEAVAQQLSACGAHIMRGEFVLGNEAGMDVEGMEAMRRIAKAHRLATMITPPSPAFVGQCAEYADIVAAGVRNMQNRDMHRELGSIGKPVLLRRSPGATCDEWLRSAEYIVAAGNAQVILLERGIRTFEPRTGDTPDVSAVPVLSALSHLPVFGDATYAAARPELIEPLARAYAAAGASGLFVGFDTLDGGKLALDPQRFGRLVADVRGIAEIVRGKEGVVHG